ncbi:MAG: hypothetical protein IIU46_02785 [Treponema sp.]|nr:hypothetical protein [Treponema sp.]
MKTSVKLIAIAASVLCFAGCKGKSQAEQQKELDALANDLAQIFDSAASSLESSLSTQDSAPIEISFGDMDAMMDFSKKCQNLELTVGQSVTIDGVLSQGFSSLSIGQKQDGKFIGTTLEVEGWESKDWPEDESRVKVNATVKMNQDAFYLYLSAKPADVSVISGPAE